MNVDSISVISSYDISYNNVKEEKENNSFPRRVPEEFAKGNSVVNANHVPQNEETKENLGEKTNGFIQKDYSVELSNSISVVSIHSMPCNEDTEKATEKQENGEPPIGACKMLFLLLGTVALSVVFVVPFTIIPRKNSIVYQANWMEICLPLVFFWISTASADMLNLKVWTKECSLMSIRVLLKMSILYNISAFLIHIMSHLIWTVHLGFNHPLPNLGTVIILTTWIIAMIGHWFLLPSDLLAKEDFRKKLRTYIIYFLWNIIVNVAREGLSYLFYNFPTKLQFIAPFFVAGFREFDKRITSKIVNKMMGQQDEPATALVSITISCVYGFFIAVRLTGATLATIFCTAAIDLVLHLNVTRQIIHEHKKSKR